MILVRDLLAALGGGAPPTPTFLDGLRAAEIVAAAQASADSGAWTSVEQLAIDG